MSNDAPVIEITEPAIMVIINRKYRVGMSEEELFGVASGNWVVGKRREKAEYVFAVANGIVKQVYTIERWVPTITNEGQITNRWIFEGDIAENLQHYVGGSIERYVVQGAQNPVKYINC